MKVTARQYGEICDVVERNYHGWPLTDDSGIRHTSKEARAAAFRILGILGLQIQDPRDADPGTDCPDCGIGKGETHLAACDVARCLVTGGQRLSCGEDHDHGDEAWTGLWPGEAECVEFGWFSVYTRQGYQRCTADTPGAEPDLNRLNTDARWDRAAGRWVAKS